MMKQPLPAAANAWWVRFPLAGLVPLLILLGALGHAGAAGNPPMYCTDSHGASGVAHALLELSAVDPKYTPYWKGALDWLVAVADKDEAGRMLWPFAVTESPDRESRRIVLPGTCHIANQFRKGYELSGDARYKEAFLAALRALTEKTMLTRQTELGAACGWPHDYSKNDCGLGVLAGHSHGLGNFIETVLEGYKMTHDERLKEILRGMLVNLKLRGKPAGDGGFAWPTLKNDAVFETGYCYGQAGVTLPLLDLAVTLPDLKLSDGTSALSLANANLRYLMGTAQKTESGCVWPYMRHEKKSRNTGYGSGTGGIGWAFLRGAQVNKQRDPVFADQCLKHARGAADFAAARILAFPETTTASVSGGDSGFGVCGGIGGSGHFLMLFAEEVRDSDPEFARRLKAAIARSGRLLLNTAIKHNDTLIWKQHPRTLNMALDYGQTGMVFALTMMGRYLNDNEFLDAARRGADFIIAQGVRDRGGYKFPWQVILREPPAR